VGEGYACEEGVSGGTVEYLSFAARPPGLADHVQVNLRTNIQNPLALLLSLHQGTNLKWMASTVGMLSDVETMPLLLSYTVLA
jgi:hypothetical protein